MMEERNASIIEAVMQELEISDIEDLLSEIIKIKEHSLFGVRPEVVQFAQNMEFKLRKNEDKGGWEDMGLLPLFAKLGEEVGELGKVLFYGHSNTGEIFQDFMPDEITREAADVANIAMMIADQADRFERKIKEQEKPNE